MVDLQPLTNKSEWDEGQIQRGSMLASEPTPGVVTAKAYFLSRDREAIALVDSLFSSRKDVSLSIIASVVDLRVFTRIQE